MLDGIVEGPPIVERPAVTPERRLLEADHQSIRQGFSIDSGDGTSCGAYQFMSLSTSSQQKVKEWAVTAPCT